MYHMESKLPIGKLSQCKKSKRYKIFWRIKVQGTNCSVITNCASKIIQISVTLILIGKVVVLLGISGYVGLIFRNGDSVVLSG